MPIYKMDGKKNGRQKYRVRVNYIDREGKNRQIDRVAYGYDEAKDLERRLNYDLKTQTSRRITVNDLYTEYLISKQYEVRESTFLDIKKLLSTFVLPDFGKYYVDKIEVRDLQKWKNRIDGMKSGKGERFSLDYKKTIYSKFRAFLNYAVRMEYVPKNLLMSVGNFKNPYEETREMDFYTVDEFSKFISAAHALAARTERKNSGIYEWHYYVFFYIAFYTGMRKGEINALKWSDVDNNVIHIRHSVSQKLRGDDRETPPKNKSSVRDIQIPLPLKHVLDAHYDRCQTLRGFDDEWKICGGEICIRDSTLQVRNERFAHDAGIKTIRIHDFRHSHASLLANEGINIQEIARRLGHSNVNITWKTYSHLYPREEERAIKVLNNADVKDKIV